MKSEEEINRDILSRLTGVSPNESSTLIHDLLNYIDDEIEKRKKLSEVSSDPGYYHGMIMALLNIQEFILKNK
jgi:hypothetical protein